jgi:DNA modification methylase
MTVRILLGDVRAKLRELPSESVHCVVTSPPYWGLRDYGMAAQIGLEPTFDEWLEAMVGVFREVRRVLRKDGVFWLQMGDCYANDGKWGGRTGGKHAKALHGASAGLGRGRRRTGLKPKELVGQPWRLAFALSDDGWWLRRDVIWSKPNAMPETVHDRPATAHEYLFQLTRAARYWHDAEAVKEPVTGNAHSRGNGVNAKIKVPSGWDTAAGGHGSFHRKGRGQSEYRPRQNESFSAAVSGLVETRNKRSVWEIPTEGFEGAHFATFPPALVEPCILAGCPKTGTVLDPFGGAGTTGLVADRLGRDAILIELNPEYAEIARRRIQGDASLFADVTVAA